MAVIWGFDLSHMSWGSFGHQKMFDRRWHLRRERFIIYQLAMLLSLAAECTATYSLSKYENHQDHIERLSGYTASVHNNDIVAAAIVTIVFCVLVATIFGADFFFLVFWPRRVYPRWYNTTKKVLAVLITLGMAASALMSTIVVASHSSFITGASHTNIQQYTQVYSRPNLVYRRFPQNIAWVVLIWPALLSTVASTTIMFIAVAHDDEFGTGPVQREGEPLHSRNDSGDLLPEGKGVQDQVGGGDSQGPLASRRQPSFTAV
ncbi:hypothetical protein B0H34DRAFT_733101 [Crassisporium funariophilum]|nr:hypothetical protein B0H34DRAFT_733101 [Crassisporium funariophilum]